MDPNRELKQLSYKQQTAAESNFAKNLKELIDGHLSKDEEIPKEYKLKSDKGNFRTSVDFVDKFIDKCINNENENNKINCISTILFEFDNENLKFFEYQLKDLRFDQLKRLAWQFELKKNSNGYYESADEWEKHIEFLNGLKTDKEGNILNKNINEITGMLSIAYKERINNIDEFNKLTKEEKINAHNIVKNCKNLILNLIRVLSKLLNDNIKEENKKKDPYEFRDKNNDYIIHSSYNKQSIQPSAIHNDAYALRTYPNIPIFFLGGNTKFEFKPNNNQAADILLKLFNTLVSNLEAQHKYLNEQDKKDVINAIEKIKILETEIAKLITNGFNFVQNNTDITQQRINLDKINKEINNTNEKVLTLRQKIDFIITKLYNEAQEKNKAEEESKIIKDFSK